MTAQERLDATYGRDFYQENLDNRAQQRRLADAIASVLPAGGPMGIIDIGCGCGLYIERLAELGHVVWGHDGSSHAIDMAPADIRYRLSRTDITDPELLRHPQLDHTAHVAMCIEVAEHLAAEHADHLVALLDYIAYYLIVFSAAPPGQGGVDHVNEQYPEYWLERFAARGWLPDATKSLELRATMRETHAQHEYCADNFFVLRRA